jgi:hypothetical protein
VREVWSARVRGFEGQFERAVLEVDDESGWFRLTTSNSTAGSADVVEVEHDDAVRLVEVLEDELHAGPTS